jgi:hypothetical protein
MALYGVGRVRHFWHPLALVSDTIQALPAKSRFLSATRFGNDRLLNVEEPMGT